MPVPSENAVSITVSPNSPVLTAELQHTLWRREAFQTAVHRPYVCIGIRCAVSTSGVVVEDAVVGASVGVGIPKRGGTAAESRKLQLHLRQTLLHLSSQSLNKPAESHVQVIIQLRNAYRLLSVNCKQQFGCLHIKTDED